MGAQNRLAPPLAVILAAGKGTRMNSDLPKVLCPALGRPLIDWVLDTVLAAGVRRALVVVGYRADDVRRALAKREGVEFIEQAEQLGTGHAVMMCREQLAAHDGAVLVVTGDSPLIQRDSIAQLLALYERERPACILGTVIKDDPHGLGRIVRDAADNFRGIVEERDATAEQRQIREVNMSTYVFDGRALLQSLDRLSRGNRQREYYLTDCPAILLAAGEDVRALPVLEPCESLSINTPAELLAAEAEMKRLGY
jgi:bifunctional UDP-N-acetylglucosamine pyrophosphorylase/glucosamine-1-phosphate N-acetyltransferase/UDP-N-acetylglucosamine pyrophosphorylase